jgi:phosphonopyruvate decarboxylase
MKIKGTALFQSLFQSGCTFYTGVPDSVLAGFIDAIEQAHCNDDVEHIVAANEGNAVAIAAGKWLATGEVPVVYMQNSGLGNAINPLMSLTHEGVYRIPLLLIIGWRGHNAKDEPQHLPQGRITPHLLESMGIHTAILEEGCHAEDVLSTALERCRRLQSVVAVLVPRDALEPLPASEVVVPDALPHRGEVLGTLLKHIPEKDIIVSSTGFISRDLLHQCRKDNRSSDGLFMNVGAMGHTSQIALGIALGLPDRTVWCIEGDGSFLMHLGAAATTGNLSPPNLKHIVLDNGIHASVGGMRHAASRLSLSRLASGFGYRQQAEISVLADLEALFSMGIPQSPALLVIRISEWPEALMRPDRTLIEFRDRFIHTLRQSSGTGYA